MTLRRPVRLHRRHRRPPRRRLCRRLAGRPRHGRRRRTGEGRLPGRLRGRFGRRRRPSTGPRPSSGGGSFDTDGEGMEGSLVREPTLARTPAQAAGRQPVWTPAQSAIAAVLIDAVDEGGYLRLPTWPRRPSGSACDLDRVEAVLAGCRASSPPASSPATCANASMLQLKERDRYDPAMAALLDNLELLARRDIAGLRKRLRRRRRGPARDGRRAARPDAAAPARPSAASRRSR